MAPRRSPIGGRASKRCRPAGDGAVPDVAAHDRPDRAEAHPVAPGRQDREQVMATEQAREGLAHRREPRRQRTWLRANSLQFNVVSGSFGIIAARPGLQSVPWTHLASLRLGRTAERPLGSFGIIAARSDCRGSSGSFGMVAARPGMQRILGFVRHRDGAAGDRAPSGFVWPFIRRAASDASGMACWVRSALSVGSGRRSAVGFVWQFS